MRRLNWQAIDQFIKTHSEFTTDEIGHFAGVYGPDVLCRMRAAGYTVVRVRQIPGKRGRHWRGLFTAAKAELAETSETDLMSCG